jgi:hypothetical protein
MGAENGDTTPYTDQSGTSRIGSYFGARFELQPVKYLRFYGLFVMDQLQLAEEVKNHKGSLTPNAMGVQGGLGFSYPISSGYLDFGLEGVYTQPYLYTMYHKRWSFYKEYPEIDNVDVKNWTGTPFGPDTVAGSFKAGFEARTNWALTFFFVFAAQGERSDIYKFDNDDFIPDKGYSYSPMPENYNVTRPPTGIPQFTYTASLRGEWKPLKWIRLTLQPGYRVIRNSNHTKGKNEQGFEIALSVQFTPPVSWALGSP